MSGNEEEERGEFNPKITYGQSKPSTAAEYYPAVYLTETARVVGYYLKYMGDVDQIGVFQKSLHTKSADGEQELRVGYINEEREMASLGFSWEKPKDGTPVYSFRYEFVSFEDFLSNRINKDVELNIALFNRDGQYFNSCNGVMDLPCDFKDAGMNIAIFDKIVSAEDGVYKYFSRPEVQALISGKGGEEFPEEVRGWFTGDITEDFDNIFKLIDWAKEQGYISEDTDLVVQFMRAFE